ncbi:MAG: ABC transporter ATP-binding protein [Roseibium sp.]|nr:ABC transporter ATP-binding protein [Roseibium sp.]
MNAHSTTSAAALHMSGVSRSFGNRPALKNVSLNVPSGAFVVLLGAAGAGKTTTLRIAAGLEDTDEGSVLLNGVDADGLQPKDRDVAMIFDNLALYPNKTGYENVSNPLKVRNVPRDAIDQRVHAVAGTLRIGHVLKRLPKTMSGGERQRVALGRALVREPKLFLLDEPLSSLDAMLRVELRTELKRLQQEHGYSFLLATPDFQEALAVADTIVMLVDGEVRQVASPQDIYDAPADRDVARFVGAPEINLIPATACATMSDRRLDLLGASFITAPGFADIDGEFEAGIRPEHIRIEHPNNSAIRAEVLDIEPLGMRSAVTLKASEIQLRATLSAAKAQAFSRGATVGVELALDRVLAFDRSTGRRID